MAEPCGKGKGSALRQPLQLWGHQSMTTQGHRLSLIQTVSGPSVYHKAWPSRLERGDDDDGGDDSGDYKDTMRNWRLCAEGYSLSRPSMEQQFYYLHPTENESGHREVRQLHCGTGLRAVGLGVEAS